MHILYALVKSCFNKCLDRCSFHSEHFSAAHFSIVFRKWRLSKSETRRTCVQAPIRGSPFLDSFVKTARNSKNQLGCPPPPVGVRRKIQSHRKHAHKNTAPVDSSKISKAAKPQIWPHPHKCDIWPSTVNELLHTRKNYIPSCLSSRITTGFPPPPSLPIVEIYPPKPKRCVYRRNGTNFGKKKFRSDSVDEIYRCWAGGREGEHSE